jgi:predicted RNA-binding protein with PUA-like domain
MPSNVLDQLTRARLAAPRIDIEWKIFVDLLAFKSEPDEYGIDTRARQGRTMVRHTQYQVRNMIRDEMKFGDEVIFYHSSCAIPGAAGIARISREAYADPSQFDKKSPYFDSGTNKDDPRWLLVDIEFVRKFARIVPLAELKQHPGLADFRLNQRGNRLSIFPVTEQQRQVILKLGQA